MGSDSRSRPIAARPLRSAGIGLRAAHYEDVVEQRPGVGWLEVHPENYFGGGLPRRHLHQAREHYPLSLHAVGLSLGSTEAVDAAHLGQLKELVDLFDPFLVSDHVSWSASGNAHFPDLLPLPYTGETLERLIANLDRVQNVLQRQILVENPSTYVSYAIDEMVESEFMNEVACASGCGILLDVNNVFVQSYNHSFDPFEYVARIRPDLVGEIHLAGHTERSFDDATLLIDTHNRHVGPEVWALYEFACERFGEVPSLVEWDSDIPDLGVLVAESDKAQEIVERSLVGGVSAGAAD